MLSRWAVFSPCTLYIHSTDAPLRVYLNCDISKQGNSIESQMIHVAGSLPEVESLFC